MAVRRLAFVLPTALALAAGGVIGYAAADSGDDPIGACYVLEESVRFVTTTTDCRTATDGTPAEQFASLSLNGSAGTRFVTRFKRSGSGRAKRRRVALECASGETAIAGSALLRYPKSTPTPSRPVPLFVTESRPMPANVARPEGWLIVADAIARYSRPWSVQINVTCARSPG